MNEITTTDLGLATFLSVKGCKIIGISDENRQYSFTFIDSQNRNTLLNDYFNRELNENSLVPALEFNDKLRSIKTLCHTRFKNLNGNNIKNAYKKLSSEMNLDEKKLKEIIEKFYQYSEV